MPKRGLLVLLASGTCLAQMHPMEPAVNLGDTSFLDALGGPGFLLEQIGDAYHSGTTTDPKINGINLHASPEQAGSIGPGVLWDRGQYLFYVNAYHEAGALNRPQGSKLVLRVQWVPGRGTGIGSAN